MTADQATGPDGAVGAEGGAPHVVMIVGGDVTVDTRVRRMAVAVSRIGLRVTVIGYSLSGRREEGQLGAGVRLISLPVPDWLRESAVRHAFRRPSSWLRLSYPSRAEAKAARERMQIRQRELAAARGRLLAGGGGRGAGAALTVRGASVKLRRQVVRVRSVLWTRRFAGMHGNGFWDRVPGVREVRRGQAWVRWRPVLPELEDYELAYGRLLDELRPDLIHAHDVHMIGIAERAANRHRLEGRSVRTIYDAHEWVAHLPTYPRRTVAAYVDLEREYIGGIDRVVTVTADLAAELQRTHRLARTPEVVMNIPALAMRDHHEGPSVRVAAAVPEDAPLLVYAGKTAKERGVHTMVEALPELPGVHVAVIAGGDTGYVRSLRTTAERLGCAERLHILSYVPSEQLVAFLSPATIGVIPLLHTGNHEVALANKLFEYLYAGLPVVVSDCRAQARFVHDWGVGEVYRAGDAAALAGAVRKVLADRGRYLKSEAEHPELFEEYSWERQERRLHDLYRELLGRPLPVRAAEPVGEAVRR